MQTYFESEQVTSAFFLPSASVDFWTKSEPARLATYQQTVYTVARDYVPLHMYLVRQHAVVDVAVSTYFSDFHASSVANHLRHFTKVARVYGVSACTKNARPFAARKTGRTSASRGNTVAA